MATWTFDIGSAFIGFILGAIFITAFIAVASK